MGLEELVASNRVPALTIFLNGAALETKGWGCKEAKRPVPELTSFVSE